MGNFAKKPLCYQRCTASAGETGELLHNALVNHVVIRATNADWMNHLYSSLKMAVCFLDW